MSRVPVPTVVTAALLVIVLLTYALTFQVRFSESAVRVRLGKANEGSIISEPGFYARYPWPIETIVKYDDRMRVLDTPEIELKTRDGKNLIVGCYAIWRIKDPLQFYVSLQDVRNAEQKLRTRVNQARAAIIGQRDLSAFVNLDESVVAESYKQMETQMHDLAAKSLADEFGVELVSVAVRRISLPQEVTEAVFAQMIQARQALAERYRSEGTGKAEAIKAEAESASKQILAFADRKAQEIESQGVAASKRILEQIPDKDRAFFEYLRELDALAESLKQRSTIFLDVDEDLFRQFLAPPVEGLGGKAQTNRAPTDEELKEAAQIMPPASTRDNVGPASAAATPRSDTQTEAPSDAPTHGGK